MNIHVPAPELQSDVIAITGLAANLDRAKAGLLERVRELQAEQEDRVSAQRGFREVRQPALAPPGNRWLEVDWVPNQAVSVEILLRGGPSAAVRSRDKASGFFKGNPGDMEPSALQGR